VAAIRLIRVAAARIVTGGCRFRSGFVQLSFIKITLIGLFVAAAAYVHRCGRVRHRFWRQVTDHSIFLAPIDVLLYLTSRVPSRPFIDVAAFPELKPLQDNWTTIRDEALALENRIRAADACNDAGFNPFFRTGWKRFYLFWYGVSLAQRGWRQNRWHQPGVRRCVSGAPAGRGAEEAQPVGVLRAEMAAVRWRCAADSGDMTE
jgi:hypothetical protein